MNRLLVYGLLLAAMLSALAAYSAVSQDAVTTVLSGFGEVPPISTAGTGTFTGNINRFGTRIDYKLSYSGLSGKATMAHLHFGQPGVNGGIFTFLCGGGTKTDPCPSPSGTVSGSITETDIAAVASQGIDAQDLAEVIRAIRAGLVYANVHSERFPSGEIRGQLRAQ